jgi:hypothetical protein
MEVSIDGVDNEGEIQKAKNEENAEPMEVSFDSADNEDDKAVINLEHDTDDDDFLQIMDFSNSSKAENKIDKIWDKFECGGINCHGKIECKAEDCRCSPRDEAINFSLLQSLCKHMLLLNNPHRKNDSESWSSFATTFFLSKKNEIPFRFKNNTSLLERYGGRFLSNQWSTAKRIYMQSVDELQTPFLEDCARVIDDKNDYEKQVTIKIKIQII